MSGISVEDWSDQKILDEVGKSLVSTFLQRRIASTNSPRPRKNDRTFALVKTAAAESQWLSTLTDLAVLLSWTIFG